MFQKSKMLLKVIFFSCVALSLKTTWAQDLVVSPSPLYLGKIPLESTSEREIIIFNTTVNQITVNSISITGSNASEFSILNDPGSFNLGAIAKKAITISYQPAKEEKSVAVLNVSSSAGSYSDTLIGYGISAIDDIQTFERILGTNEADNSSVVKETSDGGFIIAGSTTPSGDNYPSLYLIKTNQYGKMIWSSTYGDEDGPDSGSDVVENSEGDYLVFGTTDNWGEGGTDMFLLKYSAAGDFQWRKTYGSGNNDAGSAIIETNDGGYALIGQTVPASGIGKTAYLLKLNSEGEQQWSNTYGGGNGTDASDLIELDDGSLIFAGFITINNDFQVYIVKVNSIGNLIWEKNYGGDNFDYGFSVHELLSGDLVVSGYTASKGAGARDGYLLKLSADGDLIWDKAYGFENSDEFKDVVEATDGSLIAVGNSITRITQDEQYSDGYIVKTGSDGNQIWYQLYGGTFNDAFSSVNLTSDGGFIIGGSTGSYSKDSDVYLIKIGSSGNVSDVSSSVINTIQNEINLYQNYPNPFNPATKITFSLSHESFQQVKLKIYDILGNEIKTLLDKKLKSGYYSIDFKADNLSSGIYVYQITSPNTSVSRKMVFLK